MNEHACTDQYIQEHKRSLHAKLCRSMQSLPLLVFRCLTRPVRSTTRSPPYATLARLLHLLEMSAPLEREKVMDGGGMQAAFNPDAGRGKVSSTRIKYMEFACLLREEHFERFVGLSFSLGFFCFFFQGPSA